MKKYRIEKDSLGNVSIPHDAPWGPVTQRAIENFAIGSEKMPPSVIDALLLIKRAAASSNYECGVLSKRKKEHICKQIEKIEQALSKGSSYLQFFPLSVWQTGSGTQTNMNVNEVIAGKTVHPNDDVNRSQSSNDVFPSAIAIAATLKTKKKLLPALQKLKKILAKKKKAFSSIKKVGRTHLMDACSLFLGDEFSAYEAQIDRVLALIPVALKELSYLALGGTAVGSCINAPTGFSKKICKKISDETKVLFQPAKNSFEAVATSDACVFYSSVLKTAAQSLYKIANDIRLMASGPRTGLNELILPENEPGSSIMPGKVNPTQCEQLMMVAIQVLANDTAISFAGSQGNFELNTHRPLIAYNLLQSVELLADSVEHFCTKLLDGIKPNRKKIAYYLEQSLIEITELTPKIGYDMAAKLVQKAYKENKTLDTVLREL